MYCTVSSENLNGSGLEKAVLGEEEPPRKNLFFGLSENSENATHNDGFTTVLRSV
jgi:hypothetical protein